MKSEIEALSGDVSNLSDKVDEFNDRLTDVESGLTQEIADRERAIIDLIGTSADSRDYDTIWGAKNYAKSVKQDAVDEAKDYTDGKVTYWEGLLSNYSAETEQKLSGFATKEYVLSACQDTERELRGEFGPALSAETETRQQKDDELEASMQILSGEVYNGLVAIAHNSTRLNAITDWDGETPEDYPSWAATHPNAKGILDVLHREFHQLIDTLTQKGILP